MKKQVNIKIGEKFYLRVVGGDDKHWRPVSVGAIDGDMIRFLSVPPVIEWWYTKHDISLKPRNENCEKEKINVRLCLPYET